jgi:hypothetical protein
VYLRIAERKRVLEYIVTDETDGFIRWSGYESDLAAAQSSAMLEAQLFPDPFISATVET